MSCNYTIEVTISDWVPLLHCYNATYQCLMNDWGSPLCVIYHCCFCQWSVCLVLRLFKLPRQSQSKPHSPNEAEFSNVNLLITSVDVFPNFKVNTSVKCLSLKQLKLEYLICPSLFFSLLFRLRYQNCMQLLLIDFIWLILDYIAVNMLWMFVLPGFPLCSKPQSTTSAVSPQRACKAYTFLCCVMHAL